jgi:Calcineurin-like phosphoesterase
MPASRRPRSTPSKRSGAKSEYKSPPVDGLVGHVSGNVVGPHLFADPQRLFADPSPGPNNTSFDPAADEQYYTTGYYFRNQTEIQPFPRPSPDPPRMDLSQILGPNLLQPVLQAQAIAFHAVGDSGATTTTEFADETTVADAMVGDVEGDTMPPSFLFHLGDVVYNFGEGSYYYEQFYEPYRNYDRPIFAIPGNHDGMVYGPDPNVPVAPTLQAFLRNFCANAPGPSPDAPSIARTTMTQPGVYFTLDAPFVSIIGLYSNVLEHPGVISSQRGHFALPDDQLTFLQSELNRLKDERAQLQRAIVLAVHHPPVSFDGTHGSSPTMANEIDEVCNSAGVWPDLVLSGHAHLYQRFSRDVAGRSIPYVVSGSGGHLLHPPRKDLPKVGQYIGQYKMEIEPIFQVGYLTIVVDLSPGSGPVIKGRFSSVAATPTADSFTLNLKTGVVE